MKKIFALVLTFALTLCTLSALTSCGGAKFDENKNISVVAREDGSGTKSAFMEIIILKGKADECEDKPKLLDFYQNEKNGFHKFSERYDDDENIKYIQLVRMF